jgi:hypothetical protein
MNEYSTVNTGLNRETILLSGFSHLAQALFKTFLQKSFFGKIFLTEKFTKKIPWKTTFPRF